MKGPWMVAPRATRSAVDATASTMSLHRAPRADSVIVERANAAVRASLASRSARSAIRVTAERLLRPQVGASSREAGRARPDSPVRALAGGSAVDAREQVLLADVRCGERGHDHPEYRFLRGKDCRTGEFDRGEDEHDPAEDPTGRC